MPVVLESIHAPNGTSLNDADQHDIEKIECESDMAFLMPLNASTHRVFAGRFNDRLIGLVRAQQTDDTLWIEAIAVRQGTQRRGVAHQLLALLMNHCPTLSVKRLAIASSLIPEEFKAPLKRRDFIWDSALDALTVSFYQDEIHGITPDTPN